MTRLPLLLAFAACTQVPAPPGGPGFDVHEIDTGLIGGGALLAIDVNGDGHADLVVAGTDSLGVWLGDGRGGFRAARTVAAGANPTDVVAGDFDGDGRLDFLVANHETSHVSLIRGSAATLLSDEPTTIPVEVSPHPHAVVVADMDDDGHLDFVVDDRDAHALQIFRGRGDGRFERGRAIDVRGDPYRGMVLRDLDGDGRLDVVTPNQGVVRIQFGDARGEFTRSVDLSVPRLSPFRVAVGDFNGDGIADVAAGSGENQGRVAVWSGSSDGAFTLAPGFPRDIPRGPAGLLVADFDGDGVDDLLAASYMGDEVVLFHGHDLAGPPVRLRTSGHPWGLAAADFNGDGRMDFAAGNDERSVVSVFLSTAQR